MPKSPIPRLLRAVVGALTAALLVSGCAPSAPGTGTGTGTHDPAAPAAGQSLLAAHDLDGLSGREIITRLDATPVADRSDEFLASVQPDAVVITGASGAKASVPLPRDSFYVSIAPYTSRSHECFYHSLTTCLGELGNTRLRVTVTDTSDGAVLVDKNVRTHDNGFFGLWLPRDIEATVTISRRGQTARSTISTTDNAPTCLTGLKLT